MSASDLGKNGSFAIKDYNKAPAFSSFLPGIGGKYGIPLWCFYVNRGQCITSFGVEGKAKAILEFLPANQAYSYTYERGFRTFVKSKDFHYEPFGLDNASLNQELKIKPDSFSIEEVNKKIGLKFTIKYCTLPDEDFGALVREVTIENISKKDVELEVVDGLPQIVPYGMNNWLLKEMSRTIEAWMDTKIKNDVAVYRLRVSTEDVAETTFIDGANFYYAGDFSGKQITTLKPIVDSSLLFQDDTGYIKPHKFYQKDWKYTKNQIVTGKTPSAFGYINRKIKAGKSLTFHAVVGSVEDEKILNSFVKKINTTYVNNSVNFNKSIVARITDEVFCCSSSGVFDNYVKQNFLDNVLRGGLPESFGNDGVYYAYSRKHGDIERDYNQFYLSPTYLSAGNGNFRDVNQNRRCDIFVNPNVGRDNIYMFYNLQRPDGYNPLVVKPSKYRFKEGESLTSALKGVVNSRIIETLKKSVASEFDLGSLVGKAKQAGVKKDKLDKVTDRLLVNSDCIETAEFGEGFWIDHWTYNLDLIESYLGIFPEKCDDLFFEKSYSFYDDAHKVNPRSRRYYVKEDKVYQGNFLIKDKKREQEIVSRSELRNRVRYKGTDVIVYTSLITKLITLVCNKVATLDSFGKGIEMEAGKPGWCDALNGLPAILGSSLSETYELKRMCVFMLDKLGKYQNKDVELPRELFDFYWGLKGRLEEKLNSFDFWKTTNDLKEQYRDAVHDGFSSGDVSVKLLDVLNFVDAVLKRINKGLKFIDKREDIPSFFVSEAQKFSVKKGIVEVEKFKQRELPLFLEGFVRGYKTMDRNAVAQKHAALHKSNLYDKKLKMYKINESLLQESYEIGRNRVFKPGWLENESIWLHMEYKYILELLKSGCMKEFYNAMSNAFVCFLDPQQYGRSILENSSFIASSAYVNKKMWGRGFVARLSGSTIEAMNIYFLMVMGKAPFKFGDNGLSLEFKPLLRADMFTEKATKETTYIKGIEKQIIVPKNSFCFKFLSNTLVTYHNPSRVDTYSSKAKVKKIDIVFEEGNKSRIKGPKIPEPECLLIRSGKAKIIDVHYV